MVLISKFTIMKGKNLQQLLEAGSFKFCLKYNHYDCYYTYRKRNTSKQQAMIECTVSNNFKYYFASVQTIVSMVTDVLYYIICLHQISPTYMVRIKFQNQRAILHQILLYKNQKTVSIKAFPGALISDVHGVEIKKITFVRTRKKL